MAVDITQEYFNYHNQKKLQFGLESDEYSNFKKSVVASTPLNPSGIKCLDDSGYLSPPFLAITPLNLNECYDEEIISNVVTLLSSRDHDQNVVDQLADWQDPEEEDIFGKKEVRKSFDTIPMIRSGVKCELSSIDFTKEFGKLFDCQNIIGRKIGRKNCDIVSELDTRNISGFINNLMNCLSPSDVNCMQHVSKSWHSTCSKNKLAQRKLKEFTEEKKLNGICKENLKLKAEIVQRLKIITKSDLFQQCADSLKNDEHLQKCPKCEHPAKIHPIQDKGVCTNHACSYHYCSKCRTKYHGSAACVQVGVKRLPREIIHTKKAKKFLRRL